MRAILQEQQFMLMAVLLCLRDFHYFFLLLYRVKHFTRKDILATQVILQKITFNIKEYSKSSNNNIGSIITVHTPPDFLLYCNKELRL